MGVEKYFTVRDEYENQVYKVNQLINRLDGDYNSTTTKDGTAYSVDFPSKEKADEFDKEVEKLVPNLYSL